jgi:hypothetical protein
VLHSSITSRSSSVPFWAFRAAWLADQALIIALNGDRVRRASFETLVYGHVVRALAHAPISTEEAGRYGSVKPIAGLPGDSAKLVPTGGVVSVPTETGADIDPAGIGALKVRRHRISARSRHCHFILTANTDHICQIVAEGINVPFRVDWPTSWLSSALILLIEPKESLQFTFFRWVHRSLKFSDQSSRRGDEKPSERKKTYRQNFIKIVQAVSESTEHVRQYPGILLAE